MSVRKFILPAFTIALAINFCIPTAQADESNVFTSATMSVSWNTGQWSTTWHGSGTGGTTHSPEDGSQNLGGGALLLEWTDVFFDADPVIAGNFAVTNNTAVTQTFVLNISMPTFFPAATTTIFGGSGITINDSNINGSATMGTVPGVSMYRAKVDGVVVHTLFDSPYSLSSGFPSPILASDSQNYAFLAGPNGGVLVDIGIDHTFTLSPGDRATINSTFVIIPEPATMGLLVLGGLFILRRKSR